MKPFIILFSVLVLTGCNHTANQPVKQSSEQTIEQPAESNEYLLRMHDTDDEAIGWGYANLKGDTVIGPGKYGMCFTDTFRTYAIVGNRKSPFLTAIDRGENVLYEVFMYDNGPDEPMDGLFRMIINKKIGYADAYTGKIVIQPQFDCASPFENGVAMVSYICKTKTHEEHSEWLSDHWEYIDKTGKKVDAPKTTGE